MSIRAEITVSVTAVNKSTLDIGKQFGIEGGVVVDNSIVVGLNDKINMQFGSSDYLLKTIFDNVSMMLNLELDKALRDGKSLILDDRAKTLTDYKFDTLIQFYAPNYYNTSAFSDRLVYSKDDVRCKMSHSNTLKVKYELTNNYNLVLISEANDTIDKLDINKYVEDLYTFINKEFNDIAKRVSSGETLFISRKN